MGSSTSRLAPRVISAMKLMRAAPQSSATIWMARASRGLPKGSVMRSGSPSNPKPGFFGRQSMSGIVKGTRFRPIWSRLSEKGRISAGRAANRPRRHRNSRAPTVLPSRRRHSESRRTRLPWASPSPPVRCSQRSTVGICLLRSTALGIASRRLRQSSSGSISRRGSRSRFRILRPAGNCRIPVAGAARPGSSRRPTAA